jgi:GTPase
MAAGAVAAAVLLRLLRFSIDHCFALKGQGTILTGTVLQVRSMRHCGHPALLLGCLHGSCQVNDTADASFQTADVPLTHTLVCVVCLYKISMLQGNCQVNDTVELPALKVSKQVKSIQMFKRPVTSVTRGNRAALCVTQLNAKLLERGLAAAPGTVPTFAAAVAAVDKVRFYNGPVPGKGRYHMSIGHATVMAEATFFGLPDTAGSSQAGEWRCVDLINL